MSKMMSLTITDELHKIIKEIQKCSIIMDVQMSQQDIIRSMMMYSLYNLNEEYTGKDMVTGALWIHLQKYHNKKYLDLPIVEIINHTNIDYPADTCIQNLMKMGEYDGDHDR